MKTLLKLILLGALAIMLPAVQAQFYSYNNFTYTSNADQTVTITGYTDTNPVVVIPATIDGLPVVGLAPYAFSINLNLTSVSIPPTVTSIGLGAFYYCSGLTSINLPDGLISIGEQAFYYCSSLTNVIIPGSLKYIPAALFYNCVGLGGVSIPDGVTNIDDEAFSFCAALGSVTIPQSVTRIGHQSFELCTGLTNMAVPGSVIQLYGDTFGACTSLQAINVDMLNPAYASPDGVLYSKDLTRLIEYPCGRAGDYIIPDGVTSVEDFSFNDCRNLTGLKFPNSLTNIGYWAFSQCESLGCITIPKNVTSIGAWAFEDCTSLRAVWFLGDAPVIVSGTFFDDPVSLYFLPGTTGWDAFFSTLNLAGILWNPQVQTSDGSFGVRSNCFGFNITGTENIPVVVEACTNLSNTGWQALETNTLAGGSVYFSDAQWTNCSGRYYRLRAP